MSELSGFSGTPVNKTLAEIKNVPPDQQQLLTTALAASSEGINIIFNKVKEGEIFPRTLIQPKVEERMIMNMTNNQKTEFKALTANLETIDKEKQSLIAGRITDFNDANPHLHQLLDEPFLSGTVQPVTVSLRKAEVSVLNSMGLENGARRH